MKEKFTVTSLLFGALLFVSLGAGWPWSDNDHPTDEAVKSEIEVLKDTLPDGKMRLRFDHEGKEYNVRTDDGKITELRIDGQPVPAAEYDQHLPIIEENIADIPAPPMPPMPPTPPAPPAPFMMETPPIPPAPPAPPAPPVRIEVNTQDGEGHVRIYRYNSEAPEEFTFDLGENFIYQLEEGPTILHRFNGEHPFTFFHKGEGGGTGAFWLAMDSTNKSMAKFFRLHADSLFNGNHFKFDSDKRFLFEKDGEPSVFQLNEWQNAFDAEWEAKGKLGELLRGDWNDKGFGGNVAPAISTSRLLENKLLSDGLISDRENYTLQWTADKMVVNGKRQPDSVHQEYLRWYEEVQGQPVGKNWNISITKNKEM